MTRSHEQGYVLLEASIAMVVLLCGTLVVMDSYRASLRVDRQSRDTYAAALLIEGRMLEMEKTAQSAMAPETDPVLGSVSWNEETRDTDMPDWKEHRLILNWGEGRSHDALELTTYAPN